MVIADRTARTALAAAVSEPADEREGVDALTLGRRIRDRRTALGMTLGELSQRMMVSNGNVTGLVDRLVEQGLINRRPSPNDRRAQLVSLTAEGRRFFRAMARANGDWIGDMFAELSQEEIEALLRLLAKTKASARKAIGNGSSR